MVTRADKIDSFQATKCEFGTPLPIAYGTCKLAPNLISYFDFYAQEHKSTVKTGKKSSSTSIDYKYYVYSEYALCEGVIDGIGKVDVGSNQYNSLTELNANSGNEGSGLNLERGDNPNPTDYMLSKHPDIAIGYKDMAYLYGYVFLGENSASVPSYSVEVFGKLRNSGDGTDANPCDVIVDLLTYIGRESYIDTESFNDYRKYCKEADLLISTPAGYFDNQKKCQEVIADILKLTNAYMFLSVDRYKIRCRDDRRRGSWIPNRQIVYALTEDDFLPNGNGCCVSFSRKDSSEQYNRFGVTFINRENNYESETVFYEDTDSIIENGVKASSTLDASWFHTKERAIKVAEMQARINATENIKYSFKLDMSYCRLEPADLVTITDSSIGLDAQPCMIDSITEDAKGFLNVTAIRREKGAYSSPQYNVHKLDYNNVNFNIDPYNTAPPLFIQPPAALTSSNSYELWIALHGEHSNWGGCNVFISDQDGNYTQLGMQNKSSTFGYIVNDMTAESDSVIVKATNPNLVELLTGSEWDADNDNTLIWVDGEYVSYERAELVGENEYELFGLQRGRFDTKATAHSKNSSAASVDSDLYVVEIPQHYADRTLYFKFPAFNYFGNNVQSLENLPYYTSKIEETVKPPLSVYTLDTELLSNGVRRFWWDFNQDDNVAGFEIRYVQGNYPSWENGTKLHTGLLTAQPFETDAIRQGIHTVMIKAISNDGSESQNPAFAILNLGDPLEDNVLYRKHLNENNWMYVNHNGLIRNGSLCQKDESSFWPAPNDAFWKAPALPFWNGSFSDLELTWQTTAPASGQMWFKYIVQGNFRLEYRIVETPIDFDVDDEKSLWKPYTCKVEVKAGDIIQVKAFAKASGEETSIEDIEFIIDVVDREEHFENIEIPYSGIELPIVTPNYYTTGVRIDAIQGDVNARPIFVSKTPCVVKLVDISNNPISAIADITWQGFIKEVL